MSLPTLSQSVSHKGFHQYLNHKKKLSLRHPLPTFGSFSFFQASLWLRVDRVLQRLTKSYKSELRHLFQCCIFIPRKCPRKTPFQHTVPRPLHPWVPPQFRRLWSPSSDDGQKAGMNVLWPDFCLLSRSCLPQKVFHSHNPKALASSLWNNLLGFS